MPSDAKLVPAQRWLQDHIIRPTLDQTAAARPDDWVKPSATMTARERAGVYRGMYLLVMEEALASDYPVLKDYLGPESFAALVAEYVQVHPSRSYTLNRLGDRLPDFLRERDPLLHAIARFELGVTEAFDAESSAVLTASDVMAIPPEDYAAVVLDPIPALRLLELDHPAHRFKAAYRDDQPYPPDEPDAAWIAVYRRDYQVFWDALDPAAYSLLKTLAEGSALGPAIERACLADGADESRLFAWFQEWVSNGLFQSARVSQD